MTGTPVNQKGFVKVPKWLLVRQDFGLGPKTLWAVLANYAQLSDTGVAWPGVRRLAGEIAVSVDSIIAWTSVLEGAGMIKVERHAARSNRYTILGAEEECNGRNFRAPSGREIRTPSARVSRPLGARDSQPEEKSKNKNKKKSRTPEAASPGLGQTENTSHRAPNKAISVTENREALRLLGIANPKREQLARDPNVTAALIGEIAGTGKRNGAFVNTLEDQAARVAEGREQNDARQRMFDRERTERAAAEQETLRERQAAEDVLAVFPDDQIQAAYQQHLATIEHPTTRERYEDAGLTQESPLVWGNRIGTAGVLRDSIGGPRRTGDSVHGPPTAHAAALGDDSLEFAAGSTPNPEDERASPATPPTIPPGWTAEGWQVELERKATARADGHPETAAEYRRQAAAIQADQGAAP